jgi:hypothetical protein
MLARGWRAWASSQSAEERWLRRHLPHAFSYARLAPAGHPAGTPASSDSPLLPRRCSH